MPNPTNNKLVDSKTIAALFDMTPEGIVKEISEAGLRGRGGGGFPTGKKWEQVLRYYR